MAALVVRWLRHTVGLNDGIAVGGMYTNSSCDHHVGCCTPAGTHVGLGYKPTANRPTLCYSSNAHLRNSLPIWSQTGG